MRKKSKNKYMGLTHKELLKAQPYLTDAKDIKQFHRALCKVRKDLPFWERGMPLMDRYPNFPLYFSAAVAAVVSALAIILSFR